MQGISWLASLASQEGHCLLDIFGHYLTVFNSVQLFQCFLSFSIPFNLSVFKFCLALQYYLRNVYCKTFG
jgi:hypothetical protein